jgi:hypothetical protein
LRGEYTLQRTLLKGSGSEGASVASPSRSGDLQIASVLHQDKIV